MNIFRDNRLFFICFSLFAIVGAVLLEATPQGEDILFFSERRSAFGDWFFRWGTRLGEGPAFIAAALVFLWFRKRASLFIGLLGFTVTLVSYGTKFFFAHDRPYAYFYKLGQTGLLNPVEGIQMHSGATSFPSGHTMAAFALYSFLAFAIPRKGAWQILFFLSALIVGVSRIYLVQHFLKDVYAGAVIGVMLGMLGYAAYAWRGRVKDLR